MTRDHLRVCGADCLTVLWALLSRGSPPRVRSRLPEVHADLQPLGITSACAEQTVEARLPPAWGRDHLRVCGADRHPQNQQHMHLGSPPRVRSRQASVFRLPSHVRITSACAEQTRSASGRRSRATDHLRVCGADDSFAASAATLAGSPPRVRSRLPWSRLNTVIRGITSACAEQTQTRHPTRSSPEDHLRVCGADSDSNVTRTDGLGSPPRVRSRPTG